MSAAPARNWVAMLKEKKAAAPEKAVVSVVTESAAKLAEPTLVAAPAAVKEVPAQPVKEEEAAAPTRPTEELVPSSISAAAPATTAIGPVSLPEALAKLVKSDEFRFAGAVAPRAPITVSPHPVASQQAPATPPAPIAAAPAVTSSSEIRGHPQWTTPQPMYNPPVNYFMSQHSVARPYGGELGSVPRYYNAEQQYHAHPYHPSYQTPYYNYRGGAYGGTSYNPYDSMYQNYYPLQGTPYIGSRLQAQQPYYPPRNYQYQQQQ